MTSARLIAVPSHMLAEAWPEVAPFISAIADGSRGRYSAADYARSIGERDMQLWAAGRDGEVIGAMVTRITNFPGMRVASMIGATGRDADSWIGLMPQIERWAKIEGCAQLQAVCRPGWERLLKPAGFEKTHVILDKTL